MKESSEVYGSERIEELYKILEPIAPKLPFHDWGHLVDVSNSCERYAQLEGLNYKETFILKTSGLLHDIVYIPGRSDNEQRSVEVSIDILSRLSYSPKEIVEVSRLILATKLPTNPKDKLEMIICDSDLDGLGRDDFFERNELLRLENGVDKKEWYIEQSNFLSNVKYYTRSARELRGVKLKENLEKFRRLK